MYEKFRQHFAEDFSPAKRESSEIANPNDVCLTALFSQFSGTSFAGGLYRIMSPTVAQNCVGSVVDAFPELSTSLTCFGYDWLGRIFAVDARRLEANLPGVVMLEPGTAQALEIPCNVYDFHEIELIDFREEALAASFYDDWMSFGGTSPALNECISYKKPLFLGGKDIVENLELSNMDVSWSISSQLIMKAKRLPFGNGRSGVQDG